MTKDDRAPSSVWCLRREDLDTYVRTEPDDRILIVSGQEWIELSRPDARLLAKRINECLDATVIR